MGGALLWAIISLPGEEYSKNEKWGMFHELFPEESLRFRAKMRIIFATLSRISAKQSGEPKERNFLPHVKSEKESSKTKRLALETESMDILQSDSSTDSVQ